MEGVDLYRLLGVGRDATREQIRRAYRRLVKAAHPDAGGSVECFQALKRAHDLLMDPERRRRYDETGDATEAAPDNGLSAVIEQVAIALDFVLGAMHQNGFTPDHIDVVADLTTTLRKRLEGLATEARGFAQAKLTCLQLAGRFERREPGDNILEGIVANRIRELDNRIAANAKAADLARKAIQLVADYRYAFTQPTASRHQGRLPGPRSPVLDLLTNMGAIF